MIFIPAILLAITLVIIILIAPMKHKIYWVIALILCIIGFLNNYINNWFY